MGGLAFLCILGGLFGSVLAAGAGAGAGQTRGRRHCPAAGSGPTPFSLIAFDPARSIYDAPVIALFVAIASLTTLLVVHRLSARRTRRGPAWDCGFPDPSPATQYTASSFAQPLRRVYGAAAFAAAGDGRHAAARRHPAGALLGGRGRSSCGACSTPRPAGPCCGLSERLNALQFLTIRRYLVLMFAALVILLSIAAVMT